MRPDALEEIGLDDAVGGRRRRQLVEPVGADAALLTVLVEAVTRRQPVALEKRAQRLRQPRRAQYDVRPQRCVVGEPEDAARVVQVLHDHRHQVAQAELGRQLVLQLAPRQHRDGQRVAAVVDIVLHVGPHRRDLAHHVRERLLVGGHELDGAQQLFHAAHRLRADGHRALVRHRLEAQQREQCLQLVGHRRRDVRPPVDLPDLLPNGGRVRLDVRRDARIHRLADGRLLPRRHAVGVRAHRQQHQPVGDGDAPVNPAADIGVERVRVVFGQVEGEYDEHRRLDAELVGQEAVGVAGEVPQREVERLGEWVVAVSVHHHIVDVHPALRPPLRPPVVLARQPRLLLRQALHEARLARPAGAQQRRLDALVHLHARLRLLEEVHDRADAALAHVLRREDERVARQEKLLRRVPVELLQHGVRHDLNLVARQVEVVGEQQETVGELDEQVVGQVDGRERRPAVAAAWDHAYARYLVIVRVQYLDTRQHEYFHRQRRQPIARYVDVSQTAHVVHRTGNLV